MPFLGIDLLIICKQLPRGIFERNRLLDPVREQVEPRLRRLWARGYRGDFSEILKTEAEAQYVVPPYLDMTEDAVLLVDRGRFFAQVLDRIRARLKELGAQRKQLGTVRYWDLKPDFRPGEVIEIRTITTPRTPTCSGRKPFFKRRSIFTSRGYGTLWSAAPRKRWNSR